MTACGRWRRATAFREEPPPVSMLSFTMQVPWTSAASQGMIIPLAGMTMTSPGTRSVDMAWQMSGGEVRRTQHFNIGPKQCTPLTAEGRQDCCSVCCCV